MSPALRARMSNNADFYIRVPCGRCALCKERVAKDWKVRLSVECESTETHFHLGRNLPRVLFVTFTISPKYYDDKNDDVFAPYLVRFRDNFRKRYGKSPRYFAITDRGSQYGRLHLHMLLFNPRVWSQKEKRYTRKITNTELHNVRFWYDLGFVESEWVKNPNVSAYVCGYITGANMYREEPIKHGKLICDKALRYKPKIYPSKGLGAQWLTPSNIENSYINDLHTISLNGYFYALPRYYTTKIWTPLELSDQRVVRFAENYDYFVRNGYTPERWVFSFKDSFKTYEELQTLIHLREKFTAIEKPVYRSFPLLENTEFWNQAQLEQEDEMQFYFVNRLSEHEFPF